MNLLSLIMFKTNQTKETMETINDMIDYLEDNQNKIDNEIKDDQKAKKIFQQIENLKNDLYEFIEVKGVK
jgi:HSP90 family molecular chaperone